MNNSEKSTVATVKKFFPGSMLGDFENQDADNKRERFEKEIGNKVLALLDTYPELKYASHILVSLHPLMASISRAVSNLEEKK